MASSRVPELIDNFLAALNDSSGLAGVKVIDGPIVTDSASNEWVYVGYDGDEDGEFLTASTTQTWAGLGAKAKNEDILLTCAVIVRRGSTDVRKCRVRTFEVFAEVEAVVRADPSLGLPSPSICSISETTFRTEQTADGIRGRLPFTLAATPTRI